MATSQQSAPIPGSDGSLTFSSGSSSSLSSSLAERSQSSGLQTDLTPPDSPGQASQKTGQPAFNPQKLFCPLGERASHADILVTPKQKTFHHQASDAQAFEPDVRSVSTTQSYKLTVTTGSRMKDDEGKEELFVQNHRHSRRPKTARSQRSQCNREVSPESHGLRPTSIDLEAIAAYQYNYALAKVPTDLGLGLPSNHPMKTPRASTVPQICILPSQQPLSENLGSFSPSLHPNDIVEIEKPHLQPTPLSQSPSPIDLLPESLTHSVNECSSDDCAQSKHFQASLIFGLSHPKELVAAPAAYLANCCGEILYSRQELSCSISSHKQFQPQAKMTQQFAPGDLGVHHPSDTGSVNFNPYFSST